MLLHQGLSALMNGCYYWAAPSNKNSAHVIQCNLNEGLEPFIKAAVTYCRAFALQ